MKMKIQNSKQKRHWDLGNSAKDLILVYLALHESGRHVEGLGFGCSLIFCSKPHLVCSRICAG